MDYDSKSSHSLDIPDIQLDDFVFPDGLFHDDEEDTLTLQPNTPVAPTKERAKRLITQTKLLSSVAMINEGRWCGDFVPVEDTAQKLGIGRSGLTRKINDSIWELGPPTKPPKRPPNPPKQHSVRFPPNQQFVLQQQQQQQQQHQQQQ
ncbi:hypothetical protein Gpo141_00001620 [Globisporangium polare]